MIRKISPFFVNIHANIPLQSQAAKYRKRVPAHGNYRETVCKLNTPIKVK